METTVVRHASELGRWETAVRAPHPRLRPFVRSYHGHIEATPAPLRRREMPTVDVPVIMSFGDPWDITLGPAPRRPERSVSFVGGLHDGWVVSEHSGSAHGVQVMFTAVGAGMFLGLPLGELAGRVVALEDALGPAARRLVERLAEAPSWEARFDLLDAVVAARLARAEPPPPDLLRAWSRLRATEGRAVVSDLVRELGCSRRHLNQRFREHLGLTPKALARLLRFERALRLARERGAGHWAEVAQDCGYYDQSHLHRDFRAFAGTTPAEWLARQRPDGGGISF